MSPHSRMNAEWRRKAKAVIWAERIRRGGLTPYQRCMFEVWRASDENAWQLALQEDAWEQLPAVLAEVLAEVLAKRARPPAPGIFECVKSWRWKTISSGVVAASLVALTLWWNTPASQSGQVQVIETQAQALADVALADRSVASLQPGARMRFELSETTRLVHEPQGEIFFDVAKDPNRPFIVSMGKHSVRAVGTRFAVQRNDDEPLVTVEEGIVAVKRDGDEVHVTAGQQLKLVARGELIPQTVDVKKQLAWARKRLSISGMTVGEVSAAFNRHNKVQIEIVDELLARRVLSFGRPYLDEPELFVEWLADDGKVTVERVGPDTLRLLTAHRADPEAR